jgi:hypothetical protein
MIHADGLDMKRVISEFFFMYPEMGVRWDERSEGAPDT